MIQWFEKALVLVTLFTGLVWLIDKLFLSKRRLARQGLTEEKEPILVDYSKAFFPVLAVVLILRSFIAEPFRIPSSSMMPTLLIGDFILVNKFSYGLRLPISNQKFVPIGAPERGDVVVFRPPHQPNQDWIKRVIGMPGDTVAYRDHVLTVNGQPIPNQPIGQYIGKGRGADMTGATLASEELPQRPHPILMREDQVFAAMGEGEWQVPAGSYFVMGDNRDNSEDSRFWGYLPESALRGKAFLIWLNVDGKAGGIDFSRIGRQIP